MHYNTITQAKALNAEVYVAKPYASYQRGANKNTNSSIWRQWPKKMPLGQLTQQDVDDMMLIINTMPRKVLGGLTPLEVYTGASSCTYCFHPAQQAYTQVQNYRDKRVPQTILAKLKSKVASDFPNDFSTQKYVIDTQVAAYRETY